MRFGAGGLNLALQHVMDKWTELTGPDGDLEGKNVSTLSPLEVKGVVSQLEEAKAPKEDSEPITEADLKKALGRLFKRAKKAGIFEKVIVMFRNDEVDFVNTPDRAGEVYKLLAAEFETLPNGGKA